MVLNVENRYLLFFYLHPICTQDILKLFVCPQLHDIQGVHIGKLRGSVLGHRVPRELHAHRAHPLAGGRHVQLLQDICGEYLTHSNHLMFHLTYILRHGLSVYLLLI